MQRPMDNARQLSFKEHTVQKLWFLKMMKIICFLCLPMLSLALFSQDGIMVKVVDLSR